MSKYLVVILLLFSFQSFGQSDTGNGEVNKLNVGSAEFFGHSRSLISANYERIFKSSNEHLLYSLRAGIGYTPGAEIKGVQHKGITTLPVVASVLAGGKGHYAQLGLGYSYSFGESYIDSTVNPPQMFQKHEPAFSLSLGYRYLGQNIVVQAYPMLVWTNNPTKRFSFGFGVSVGGRF